MDKEMEKKQNYLRTEILEKDYDADEFIQYLVEKRGEDATDLEMWSFEDLKKVSFIYLFLINSKGRE
jgi:D-ribose pyranose/furanose isomerase RbsD